MCSPLRSRTRARTRTFGEDGVANLLGFILAMMVLLPAFVVFMHLGSGKTARVNFDAQVINTAKAAVAETYTTTDGQLRVDCGRAQAAAVDAYALFRPFNVDQFGYRLMDHNGGQSVVVTCVPAADGNGALGADVTVEDDYVGGLFTSGFFPGWRMTGSAQAALVNVQ